jgi:hypothetical protein
MLSGAWACGQAAKPKSSLSDLDLENAEAKMTLEKVLVENQSLKDEVTGLKEKLAISEASAAKLAESVTLANTEAEVFRRQTGELKARLEALGLNAGAGRESKLEERLLSAVNELRHSEEERKKLSNALIGLVEAAMNFVKVATTNQPDSRLALEAQMRRADELMGSPSGEVAQASSVPATLTDGMVISIKEELGLIVANIGSRQGVAVGMPFQVIRGDHLIGDVRMIDVRERIAGAVIQDLSSEKEKIKVGDRLKIAARQ